MDDNLTALHRLSLADVASVGGKNASLGELMGGLSKAGVKVPPGFATTAAAYRRFLAQNGLDKEIEKTLDGVSADDTAALTAAAESLRAKILAAPLADDLRADIAAAYLALDGGKGKAAVAVRSSATAEDLPDASFAGQQDTFLNIRGADHVCEAARRVFASLYTARAVAYRAHRGYDRMDIAMSVGVQKMARSDLAASGVMFTLDTESGFENAVFITASHGLGEMIVQGAVNPDEFYVYKPALDDNRAAAIIRRRLGGKAEKMIFAAEATADSSVKTIACSEKERGVFCIADADVLELARCARRIEKHYGRHMDIEWAKDGEDGEIYILQARPETVVSQARQSATAVARWRLDADAPREVIAEGRAIGRRIGAGAARVLAGPEEMERVQKGDVLIADMTDPDWEPVMKRAAAIVTRRGGRTCHAAIIARELGIPAVVGCGEALGAAKDGEMVTACCAEGDTGMLYRGALNFEVEEEETQPPPPLPLKLQINVANPDLAFNFARLPAQGVGLARLEFIIARLIGFHPRCALECESLPDEIQQQVRRAAAGYESPRHFYVEKLSEGIATLAAAFYPRPVIVRLSDFKSNEYAGLIGGRLYEPDEENPMIGFRGAARYTDKDFAPCFAMECAAAKRAREDFGLDNIQLMTPFVRTLGEADEVLAALAENGLRRGENGLKVVMMCEVPANAVLAAEFLEKFDGFSIGSNDLTQLTLALDRDSALVSGLFDERDAAVKTLIAAAIGAAKKQNKYIGICGQAPSDHPDFARWLMAQGVSAMSLNPDTLLQTWHDLAKAGGAPR